MPCYQDPYERSPRQVEEDLKYQEDIDIMTRLACDRCREIERRGGLVPGWAAQWWLEHRRADDVRPGFARDNYVRMMAIAKLTDAEREELGV